MKTSMDLLTQLTESAEIKPKKEKKKEKVAIESLTLANGADLGRMLRTFQAESLLSVFTKLTSLAVGQCNEGASETDYDATDEIPHAATGDPHGEAASSNRGIVPGFERRHGRQNHQKSSPADDRDSAMQAVDSNLTKIQQGPPSFGFKFISICVTCALGGRRRMHANSNTQ